MFLSLKEDMKSSLVVFLVALPLCLGIALASGAPLASGLFAGIIGGIVVGFLSDSSISVSGPAAGLTVIVASSITQLGSFEAFCLAVMMAGLLQLAFGLLKGGTIGDYFPASVIKGMLAAIGIILILKQLPHAVGFDATFMGDNSYQDPSGSNTFTQILDGLRMFHLGAASVSIFSLTLMVAWEKASAKGIKFFQIIPGALVAVVLSIGINQIFAQYAPALYIGQEHLVNIPFDGGISSFLSGMKLPDFGAITNMAIFKIAVTIAMVASLESLLSVDAADKMDPHSRITDKNKELVAQGIGNTLSGLIGALPVTAVIVRTSANVTAGAKSKLSCIMHGAWLALCLILIPKLLNLIPLATLASVLLLVGYKLTKPKLIKSMYDAGWNQFVPFAITIVAIIFTDLLTGIFIGMLVGFFYVIKSNVHNSIVIVEENNLYLVKFYKDVSFLQKPKLQKIFSAIPEGSSVIIDGSTSIFVDHDIVEAIEDFMKRSQEKKITVNLKRSSLAICTLFKESGNGEN